MTETTRLEDLMQQNRAILEERDAREERGEEVPSDGRDESYRRLRELNREIDALLDGAYSRGAEDYRASRLVANSLSTSLENHYRRIGFEVYESVIGSGSAEEMRRYGSDFCFYGPGGQGGPSRIW